MYNCTHYFPNQQTKLNPILGLVPCPFIQETLTMHIEPQTSWMAEHMIYVWGAGSLHYLNVLSMLAILSNKKQ